MALTEQKQKYDLPLDTVSMVSYDIDDLVLKEFFITNRELNRSIYHNTYICNDRDLLKTQTKLLSLFDEKYDVSQYWGIDTENEFATIIEKNSNFLINIIRSYKNTVVRIFSYDLSIVEDLHSKISSVLGREAETPTITWYYKDGPSVKDLDVELNIENLPCDEFYPFLDEKKKTLHEYYEEYLNSHASVLVLIGPPGTGKTSFIKGFLSYTGSNAMTSSEPDVLYSDSMFINFLTSKINVFVVEDADKYLQPRAEANPVMHKILNASDGLLSMPKTKKMIFSTNLPSVDHIDSALIRPGRCFEVLHFNELTVESIVRISDKFNLNDVPQKSNIVLADLMNEHKKNSNSMPTKKKIGFV
jgi:hypothetical protein